MVKVFVIAASVCKELAGENCDPVLAFSVDDSLTKVVPITRQEITVNDLMA